MQKLEIRFTALRNAVGKLDARRSRPLQKSVFQPSLFEVAEYLGSYPAVLRFRQLFQRRKEICVSSLAGAALLDVLDDLPILF
jgi:hypothetical protein